MGNSPSNTSDTSDNKFNSLFIGFLITVGVVTFVGIFIYCLKKAGVSSFSYKDETSNSPVSSATPKSVKVTVERFIRDMEKENPIRFSAQELKDFTKNYSKELGSGGFGVVYKGRFPIGEEIAVKVLNNMGKKAEQQFMAEVGTIGRTYHINLVRLYGFCFDPSMRALVYEYMENGSLDQYLFSEDRCP